MYAKGRIREVENIAGLAGIPDFDPIRNPPNAESGTRTEGLNNHHTHAFDITINS